jgi:hypothetical protein
VDEPSQNKLVEIELGRDVERRLDRINAIEKAADLLRSRFEGLLETLTREAVTDEDLERLELKWEKALRDAIAGLRIDFKTANEQQSKDIGVEFRGALQSYRDSVKDQQLESQTAIIAAIRQRRVQWGWWALGILAGLITSVGSTLFIVWLIGRP